MKSFSVIAIVAFASLAIQPNALAAQNITVSCGSTGQVCTNAAAFTVNAPGGTPVSVVLKVPDSHSSPVRYTVIPAFGPKISTNFLNSGQSQTVQLGSLVRGTHAFLITGTGKVGGCNAGRLGSWGVDVNP
jgi:hypothetical protein